MQELFSDPELLKSLIPTTVSLIITGLVSVLIGVFLERYRNKLTLIDYRIIKNSVARATSDKFWGDIKVFYNGNEVDNLTFSTVEVRNNSSSDISDLSIRIRSDIGSTVMASEGYVYESNEVLLLENSYYDLLEEVSQKNVELDEAIESGEIEEKPKDHLNRVQYITQNKIYHVPVLNRKTTLYFNFLVSTVGDGKNELEPIINKKGVKLVKRESVEKENKQLLKRGLIIGIVIYSILLGVLIYFNPNSVGLLLFIFFFSLIYVYIGMGLYKAYKYIVNILK